MDAKASAKSKRAHSLHGNRKWSTHANPSSKNPSQSASNSNKNQSRERNHRSRAAPNLPSNWDRYHEGAVESDPENHSADIDGTGRAPTYVVAPKSKGADFKELIAQAQTDSRAYYKSSSDVFASLDDVLPDFYQGVTNMLSVRGKSLLSWCADDNFDVDENATSGYEASFLSMDLHALAAQLEKIDVSKRLFIEPDLLPPDLCDRSKESSYQGGSLVTLASRGEHIVNEKKLNNLNEVMPSTANIIGSSQTGGLETREETGESSSLSTIAEQVVKAEPFEHGGFKESTMASNLDAATDLKDNDCRFEAAAAEAELDILLNSFGDTKPFVSGSSVMKPLSGFPAVEGGFPLSTKESRPIMATEPTVQLLGSSGQTSAALTLNDAIDDLLGETSISFSQKNEPLAQARTARPMSVPSQSSSYSGSQALDDFDSWMDTL